MMGNHWKVPSRELFKRFFWLFHGKEPIEAGKREYH